MAGRPAGPGGRRRVALVAAALTLIVTAAVVVVGSGDRASDDLAGATNPPATAPTSPPASPPARPPATAPTSPPTTAATTSTTVTTTSHPTDPPEPAGGGVLPAGFSVTAGTRDAPPPPTRVQTGEALPRSVVAQILGRLPAWSGTSGLATAFAWPTTSLTKPAAGTTITQTFPADADSQNPPATPAPTPAGALRVLRIQPRGSVSVAPFISVTFNQPMVPVGTAGHLAGTDPPAGITPNIAGHWDWIGTSTLRFTSNSPTVDRLPMATRFTVTVPAGTRSQTGGTLATAVTETFSTPPPVILSLTPQSDTPAPLRPVIVAVFNQRVDPAAVLGSVVVTADGEPWAVTVASSAQIAADPAATATVSAAPPGRTVALVPTRDLPAASKVRVTFRAGTRSAEGPLTSPTDSRFGFSTYAPMRFVSGSCTDGGCEPGGPMGVRFTNPIDADAFDPATVTVTPALPGGTSIDAAGDVITISGATQPATAYRVTVRAGLTDEFGQVLATDAESTITIGHADRRIYPFPTAVSTLDPTASSPTVTIATVDQRRFRERIFAVGPVDWAAYQSWYSHLLQAGDLPPGSDLHVPSWPVLQDRTVPVSGAADETVATILDLRADLTAGRTMVVVLVEPIDPLSGDERWMNGPTATWVQRTTLAVDAIADQTTLRAWVTDLRTGRPMSGVTVTMVDTAGDRIGSESVTDAAGLGAIDLTARGGTALVASRGDQTALLPSDMWGEGWKANPQPDQLLWYVTDDRQTYRPGETVSVKGWVRRQAGTTAMTLTTPGSGTVTWSAVDGYGTAIGNGTAALDRAGGFDLTISVPAGAHLGDAVLHLELGDTGLDYAATDHSFTIADYRTPTFEVETHAGSGGPAVRGADLSIDADATYYAGGPVGSAPVTWQVRTAIAGYSPPGWDAYTFGVWIPWWYAAAGMSTAGTGTAVAGTGAPMGPCADCDPTGVTDGTDGTVKTFHGTTDGNGSDVLSVNVGDLGTDTDGLPVAVLAQATVTDVNRQQIAGTADILVHPASYYVGLAGDTTFVKQGEELTVQAIVTGIDGTVAAGRPVTVTAARVIGAGWGDVGPARSAPTLSDPQTCAATSAATPITCTFTPALGGEYQITATVTDAQGRTSRTQLTRWVAGPDGSVGTTVAEQSLTVIPDRQEYRPGQSAQLLVASPIRTGSGLLTISHNGIVATDTFTVAGGSAVLTIPITEASVPGVSATVEVVGTVPRSTDPGGGEGLRPAYATGQIDLAVSTTSRSLTVSVRPRRTTVEPGGRTTIKVGVTDVAGKPVPDSQFEVMVVDEAALALSDYQLPDPLAAFYPAQGQNWLWTVYGRSMVMLGTRQDIEGGGQKTAAASSAAASAGGTADTRSMSVPAAPGGGRTDDTSGAKTGPSTTPIRQRAAFSSLALFRPTVTTGADGTASIPITLPDDLTRYRIMVVAVAGDTRFGTGESTITAGLPLTVRPSPPRFLNFGDRADLPVVVQNRTDAALTTDVVLQAANLTVTGSGSGPTAGAVGKQVTVPANGRTEVRFDVAADRTGTARFRVAAVSGDAADAAQQEFPVYTPSTSETFATYGTTVGNTVINQKLSAPTGVIPAFGGLRITTSSTALSELTDAVDYVVHDDYSSSDSLASQAIAISSIGDVLQAFSAPGLPTPDRMRALVVADIGTLVALQNSDGGFPYWERGQESDPFNSAQVVQALVLADKDGYAGSLRSRATAAVDRALPYLTAMDSHLPAGTSQQTRDTMNAYALAVRSLAGDASAPAAADAVASDRGAALPIDAVAWLLPVVTADSRPALLTRVTNAALDDAGSVTFTQAATDDSWTTLQSDARTDAVVLDALLTVDPTSDLIGKVVAGLMAQQRGGRWDTMQDNAFTLAAIRHYYDTYEATAPDFVAAIWLGDRLAGEHSYSGHTTEQTSVTIPTARLLAGGDTSVTLADDGSGRLYYRIGLTTAPADLSLAALDRGFAVTRSYQGADAASDVTRDAKGVWHIKAGARVRVTVTMVSRSAQTHVALTDPLPAGLEPLNPALATTSKDLAGRNASGADSDPLSWIPTWYDHQDLRDDRAEAFAAWLQGGVYTYSYLASATTPGTFVAPPASAEQVYAPETFGRSATDRVVVSG